VPEWRSFCRGLCWLVCVLALSAVPWPALADEPGGSYDELIDAALRAADRNDWAGAYSAFERAVAIEPSARALRGMGVASYRMAHYARASSLLRRALVEPGRALDAELREATESLAKRAAEHVGYCVLEPPGAQVAVTVDGEPVLLDEAGRMVVDEGWHVLDMSARGFAPRRLSVHVLAQATEHLMADLEPLDEHATQPAAPPVPPAPPPVDVGRPQAMETSSPGESSSAIPERSHPAKGGRTITWIALGAVPVFAAGAGLSWLHATSIGDDLAQYCTRTRCSSAERDALIAQSALGTYETMTNVCIVMAAASAVVFVGAYLLEGEGPGHPHKLSTSAPSAWRF
jgi:hypothetical protein